MEDMFSSLTGLSLGIGLLIIASHLLLKAALSIAQRLQIQPKIIGLVLVAFCTSSPELFVSLFATSTAPDITLTNVLGSNAFNILGILAIVSLIKPIRLSFSVLRFEYFFLLAATGLLSFFIYDTQLLRWEGSVLLAYLIGGILWSFRRAKKQKFEDDFDTLPHPIWDIGYLTISMGLLVLGAHLSIQKSLEIALLLNVSQAFIGLSILGVATGLPELITSLVASLQKRDEISVTNIIGSNLFNTLGIMGFATIINPFQLTKKISWDGAISIEEIFLFLTQDLNQIFFPILLVVIFGLSLKFFTKIHRWLAVLYLFFYGGYLYLSLH